MEDSKPNLPSAHSAADYVDGKPGALQSVIVHALGRAAIIYVGIQAGRILKITPPKNAFAISLLGALSIEIFILAYIKMQKDKEKQNNGEQSQWSI